jgi:hypothetical protein
MPRGQLFELVPERGGGRSDAVQQHQWRAVTDIQVGENGGIGPDAAGILNAAGHAG